MTPLKKFFILISILVVLTICTLGTGIYNYEGNKTEATTDKEAEKKSSEYKWPLLINKVIGSLSPAIKQSDLSYHFFNDSGCFFSLKESKSSFRSLTIKVSGINDKSISYAIALIEYKAPDYNKDDTTALAKLKNQIVTINYKTVSENISASNDSTDDTATLIILDKGGTLKINPEKGTKALMIDKDKEILLCQRTLTGELSYNKQL